MASAHHTTSSGVNQLCDDDWAIDTGATDFFCHNRSVMTNLKKKSSSVITASGEECDSDTVGTVNLKGENCEVELKDVTYVPGFKLNLFSLLRALDSGHFATFYPDICTVRSIETNEIVLTAHRHKSGLFIVDQKRDSFPTSGPTLPHCAAYLSWHSRLGHPGEEKLRVILRDYQLKCDEGDFCEDCLRSKSVRSTFRSVLRDALVPLELLHMDLVGPLPSSLRSNTYFLMVVDDNSRFLWLIPLASKAEAKSRIMELFLKLERKYELKVKRVRTDRGGEFVNEELRRFFAENGIEHETSAPYTPQQNGRAERANRTVLTVMRTVMAESGAPRELWDYAAETATYLVNRWPKKTGLSPFEVLNRRKPTIDHLHPFGCMTVMNTRKETREKLETPGKVAVFVGYTSTARNYLIYDMESKKVTESPNVRFVDTVFPFKWPKQEQDSNDSHVLTVEETAPFGIESTGGAWMNQIRGEEESQTQSIDSEDESTDESPSVSPSQSQHKVTRFGRVVRPPERLTYHALSANLDPVTCTEAMARPDADEWRKAMNAELDMFESMKVRELVPMRNAREPELDCRWILRRKPDGSYKARIVARGF